MAHLFSQFSTRNMNIRRENIQLPEYPAIVQKFTTEGYFGNVLRLKGNYGRNPKGFLVCFCVCVYVCLSEWERDCRDTLVFLLMFEWWSKGCYLSDRWMQCPQGMQEDQLPMQPRLEELCRQSRILVHRPWTHSYHNILSTNVFVILLHSHVEASCIFLYFLRGI